MNDEEKAQVALGTADIKTYMSVLFKKLEEEENIFVYKAEFNGYEIWVQKYRLEEIRISIRNHSVLVEVFNFKTSQRQNLVLSEISMTKKQAIQEIEKTFKDSLGKIKKA